MAAGVRSIITLPAACADVAVLLVGGGAGGVENDADLRPHRQARQPFNALHA